MELSTPVDNASVFHLGRTGSSYFYAMAFVEGETLEHLRCCPLPGGCRLPGRPDQPGSLAPRSHQLNAKNSQPLMRGNLPTYFKPMLQKLENANSFSH